VNRLALNRLTLNRLTLRSRLTIVYGGLFLCAGVALLAVTYLLVNAQIIGPFTFQAPGDGPYVVGGAVGGGQPSSQQYLVSQANELRQDTLASLLTQGAIALVLVGALAVLLGWLVAGRLLAPLHRITETARRIGAAPDADRGLHERIALPGPVDEVKELADTFDGMLSRLDHAFDGQRRFVANAAHELRMPLTLNRSLVEVAMNRPTASADVRQLGEVLLDINARHERLINGLLLLARTEHGITNRSYVDLVDVVEHVTDETAGQADAARVAVAVEPAEAPVLGDALLLEQLVRNLLDNAVRHNLATGGWVRLTTSADRLARLTVSNTGPAVPRYDIPSLFEPFRRAGGERVGVNGSTGLGLSIVRAIVHAHGGHVSAEPRDGGGLIITVSLPLAVKEGALLNVF
jgi:signal transduction histidine kinase